MCKREGRFRIPGVCCFVSSPRLIIITCALDDYALQQKAAILSLLTTPELLPLSHHRRQLIQKRAPKNIASDSPEDQRQGWRFAHTPLPHHHYKRLAEQPAWTLRPPPKCAPPSTPPPSPPPPTQYWSRGHALLELREGGGREMAPRRRQSAPLWDRGQLV